MAIITGEQGALLTQQLAAYLTENSTNLDTAAIVNLLNTSLPPNEKVGDLNNGVITNGIYKRL